MRRTATILFLLIGATFAACGGPPESRVALSEPGEAAYDERLPGVWAWSTAQGAVYLHIAPCEDSAALDVVAIIVDPESWGEEEPVRWLRASAHASEIDGETIYNVRRVAGAAGDYTAPGESPGFILLGVALSDEDELVLRFMDMDVLEEMIDAGQARGRELYGRYRDEDVPYLMLDLDRAELVALIREVTPAKLFANDSERFRRLAPAQEPDD